MSIMRYTDSQSETFRIEAFSDGVFAIAITLLILEIKVPAAEELHNGLLLALLNKWPSYLAFFIGFFTILVCWINHHFVFKRIAVSSHRLILANAVVLFAVSFAPFPTAVLAESFNTSNLQTAVHMFGLAYILMALCYRTLSSFVYNDKEKTYTDAELTYKKSIQTMYSIAIVHTTLTFVIIFYSILASLFLYVLLFSMFLFPDWYTGLVVKLYTRKHGTIK